MYMSMHSGHSGHYRNHRTEINAASRDTIGIASGKSKHSLNIKELTLQCEKCMIILSLYVVFLAPFCNCSRLLRKWCSCLYLYQNDILKASLQVTGAISRKHMKLLVLLTKNYMASLCRGWSSICPYGHHLFLSKTCNSMSWALDTNNIGTIYDYNCLVRFDL